MDDKKDEREIHSLLLGGKGKQYKAQLTSFRRYLKQFDSKKQLRLHFNGLASSNILNCFNLFFKKKCMASSVLTRLHIKYTNLCKDNMVLKKIFKRTDNLESLKTLFIMQVQPLRDIIYQEIYKLVTNKSKKYKLNVSVIKQTNLILEDLSNVDKTGYLLQQIAINCGKYFYVWTNIDSNELYLKKLLTAVDIMNRKQPVISKKVYVGNYILPQYGEEYKKYAFLKGLVELDRHNDVRYVNDR